MFVSGLFLKHVKFLLCFHGLVILERHLVKQAFRNVFE